MDDTVRVQKTKWEGIHAVLAMVKFPSTFKGKKKVMNLPLK